jgi:hypothetical protein
MMISRVPTSMRPLPLSLAAAALALTAACHTTSEPAPVDRFDLTSVDGRPLPTTRTNDPSSNGATILHEELVLDGSGVATRSTTVEGATPSTPATVVVSYAYTRVGDVITLNNVLCGPAALCIQHFPEQGSIEGDVLTLSPVPSLLPTGGATLVYRRRGNV